MSTDTEVRPDEDTVVHLFDGPFVTIGSCTYTVPEGSKRLLAYVIEDAALIKQSKDITTGPDPIQWMGFSEG